MEEERDRKRKCSFLCWIKKVSDILLLTNVKEFFFFLKDTFYPSFYAIVPSV